MDHTVQGSSYPQFQYVQPAESLRILFQLGAVFHSLKNAANIL